MQAKTASNVKVIDVSHHQGSIDWHAVKAGGVQGVFIKATEGKTSIDLKFSANATAAIQTDMPIGFYHYAHPELNDPYTEAAQFVKTVKPFKSQFPHVLDVEAEANSNKNLTAWCVTWLKEVERLTGHPTMIYTGASFAKNYLRKDLSKWPLWVAHYGAETPMTNSTWNSWSVFQYTSSGTVKGITGNVDVNAMEKALFDKYTQPKGEDYEMKSEDANKIISLLGGAYGATADKEAKEEYHRLANELRKASGQPVQ